MTFSELWDQKEKQYTNKVKEFLHNLDMLLEEVEYAYEGDYF